MNLHTPKYPVEPDWKVFDCTRPPYVLAIVRLSGVEDVTSVRVCAEASYNGIPVPQVRPPIAIPSLMNCAAVVSRPLPRSTSEAYICFRNDRVAGHLGANERSGEWSPLR